MTGAVAMQQPDARYGCGYRNIQVMMSFLTRRGQEYAQRVFGGRIPSVHALQRSIELSWQQGFDVDGAAQLVRLPNLLFCIRQRLCTTSRFKEEQAGREGTLSLSLLRIRPVQPCSGSFRTANTYSVSSTCFLQR